MIALKEPIFKANSTTYLTEHDWQRCQKFAAASIDTSYRLYRARGTSTRSKCFYDIAQGKLAELALQKLLENTKNSGLSITQPVDFKAYHPSQKSYDADVKAQGTNKEQFHFHVKTCCQPDRISWLFQNNEDYVQNFLQGLEPNASNQVQNIAALFTTDIERLSATLHWLVDVDGFRHWELPYGKRQQQNKQAIYHKTLVVLTE